MKTISIYMITAIVVSFFLRTSIKDDIEIYDHLTSDMYDHTSEPMVDDIDDTFFSESNLDLIDEIQLSSIEVVDIKEE